MYSNEPIYEIKSNFWVNQNDFEYTSGSISILLFLKFPDVQMQLSGSKILGSAPPPPYFDGATVLNNEMESETQPLLGHRNRRNSSLGGSSSGKVKFFLLSKFNWHGLHAFLTANFSGITEQLTL